MVSTRQKQLGLKYYTRFDIARNTVFRTPSWRHGFTQSTRQSCTTHGVVLFSTLVPSWERDAHPFAQVGSPL